MRYYYTGTIRQLRQNGFKVYREKDKDWTFATRNYETDKDNSLFIWLGNFPKTSYTKNEVVFNIGGRDKTKLPEYISDLIEKGFIVVENDDNRKSN